MSENSEETKEKAAKAKAIKEQAAKAKAAKEQAAQGGDQGDEEEVA